MERHDRSYDYGLRGFAETAGPHGRVGPRFRRGGYDRAYDERGQPRVGNRVTARYNLDYVYGARGPRYDRNFAMYTGDVPERMGDPRMYRRPYTTHAGTRTLRGSNFPTGYDRPDYGPDYGGRYPDELY